MPPIILLSAPGSAANTDRPWQAVEQGSPAVELSFDGNCLDGLLSADRRPGELESRLDNLNASLGACSVEAEWVARHLDDTRFEALLALLSNAGCYELICYLTHADSHQAAHLDRAGYLCRPLNFHMSFDHHGTDPTIVPSTLHSVSSPNLCAVLDWREHDLTHSPSQVSDVPPRTRWVRIRQEQSEQAQRFVPLQELHGLLLEAPGESS